MLYLTLLFCRYYYLAFRAHQTPLANKESCVAILEKSRLDHWMLGKTKVVASLLFESSLVILHCIPLSLVSDMNGSINCVAQQTSPQPNNDLVYAWIRCLQDLEDQRRRVCSCSACSVRAT